jgi:hypothetical protein
MRCEEPLAIEWEDDNMHRDQGAPEALAKVREPYLVPSDVFSDDTFQQAQVEIERRLQ